MFVSIRLLLEDVRSLLRNQQNRLIGHLGGGTDKTAIIVRLAVQVLVTIAVLAFCLPIIFSSSHSERSKELAAGFIGTVVGYWLR